MPFGIISNQAWKLYQEGRALEVVDAAMVNSINVSEMLRSIQVALLCVQQSPEDRPSMSSVVLMLGNDGALPQPKEPGFFTERKVVEFEYSTSRDAPSSVNEVTITLLEARQRGTKLAFWVITVCNLGNYLVFRIFLHLKWAN